MKAGKVALIGRPNTGKSTLINQLLKHKASITSPKPQTTRFPIYAVYEDKRGQIIFVDTPGIFGKVEDPMARHINTSAEGEMEGVDAVIYMIDHTRERDFEENKVLGIVRKITAPKILVVNKIDVKKPSHRVQYLFLEQEFDTVIEVSALNGQHIGKIIDKLFTLLPESEPLVDTSTLVQPVLNMDSSLYIAEIIREKAFLFLRREVPYRITTVVDKITKRDSGSLYVQARILVTEDKYKRMVIGHSGSMIKEISMASRKELETASNKKVFIDLTVETDPHWMERY